MTALNESTNGPGRRIVIGVGNPLRSDDGLGIEIAGRIRTLLAELERSIKQRHDAEVIAAPHRAGPLDSAPGSSESTHLPQAFEHVQEASSIVVHEATGEGVALMELWKPNDRVIIVDAARSFSQPGRIHRFDALIERIPSDFLHYSTHAFGVAEAIEMSRALDRLPGQLVLYGVEGADFSAGSCLSSAVAAVVPDLVKRVLSDLSAG